ncbi:hypothetical protein ABOM_005627 [Aspergillus bombycis]|uniref:FAD/NAD(P)-binding domain-containing protein n=1 Tax=Aspergillus bombycis TaxID=109264 RepID=A0A1F8A0W7_9EURO|nr:hypothetical protein ABOM_005627 [Aspergillus bombycis]OGM45374.1 hypothetical protein ABOM_005627 [Aspergillus bombycis]
MDQKPLPMLTPGLIDPKTLAGDGATKQAQLVLNTVNAALAAEDEHKRYFSKSSGNKESGSVKGGTEVGGPAIFLSVSPVLQFIDCPLTFRAEAPAATCNGKMLLLPTRTEPENEQTAIRWMIWISSTRLTSLDVQPEDESLLQLLSRQFDNLEDFETDVFIMGGGNVAVTLCARLRALGIESLMVDKNPYPGDNWALQYDCMKFHIATSYCDMPFMPYGQELRTPHILTKGELTAQVRCYVETFNLNMINSAEIQSTQYDPSVGNWEIIFQTPTGLYRTVSKQLLLSTGIGSQIPHIPAIGDQNLYQGISLHSAQYKNARELKEKGARSVLIIGSANTAFDIEGQLAYNLFAQLASNKPECSAGLKAIGFPVIDCSDPRQSLLQNLLERAGSHYVDVGGTKLIEECKVRIKAGTESIGYTTSGLRFSNGTTMDTNTIIWCTGFADSNERGTASQILGGNSIKNDSTNRGKEYILGAWDTAEHVEGTWGLDTEGEIGGMWKRHQKLDNFWIMGGYTQQHRWYSRTLALQIKAALAGILPPAYRKTPRSQAA